MMSLRTSTLLSIPSIALLATSLAACGGGDPVADAATPGADTNPMVDTGMMTGNDSGPATTLGTCAMPRMVTLAMGTPSTVTGSTAGGPDGTLMLGECGANPMSTDRPPQEVLAIQVPGSGDVGITFDLTGATAMDFDTVVQVRTACETTPTDAASTCFDDVSMAETRSAGSFMATGGSTVYLVLTGFPGAMTDRGAYSMVIEARPNAAPTLTDATARRVADDRLEIFATGMDADSNAVGVGVQFLGADGMPLPADPAGAPMDVGPYYLGFDAEVTTTAFTNQLVTGPGSADVDVVGTAVSLRVFAFDEFGARSATRDVMIGMVSEVGFGEMCDATRLCRAPNVCEAGVCAPSPETRALCTAATAVSLTAPTGSAPTSAMQTVMLAAGEGVVSAGTCEQSAAAERVLAVTVPAGTFDLVASTNLAANPIDTDTVVYVRSTCENETTELVCDDDYLNAPDGDYRSVAVVENAAAGVHFVFVDGYAPFDAATTVQLELQLRPVLATGAACDPTGVMNRCAMGACPASGMAVCP
jgi:hypothetical protein